LVLDMCDPDWMDENTRDRLLQVMPWFDLATGSTMPLVNWMGENVPAYLVNDGIDLSAISHARTASYTRRPSVCWFGYEGNMNIDSITPDLVANRIDVDVIYVSKPVPFDLFVETISRYDIMLNPRSTTGAHPYKSENKSDAAWMAGVAVVRDPGDMQRLMDPEIRAAEISAHQKSIAVSRNARLSAGQLWRAIVGEINHGSGND